MRTFVGIIGVLITLFSSFFVVNAIYELIFGSKTGTGPGILAGLLVFFLGTGFAGLMMAKKNLVRQTNAPPELSDFEQEQLILALAKKLGGRVTVSEVALNCHLSIDNCKKALDRMSLQGVAEMQVNDDGSFSYHFVGFLSMNNQTTVDQITDQNRSEQQQQTPPRNQEMN